MSLIIPILITLIILAAVWATRVAETIDYDDDLDGLLGEAHAELGFKIYLVAAILILLVWLTWWVW